MCLYTNFVAMTLIFGLLTLSFVFYHLCLCPKLSKKLRGHIAFGLSVHPSVRPFVHP